MSSENSELIEMVRSELHSGFALLTTALGETNSRLDLLDNRLANKFEQIDQRFDQIDQRFDGVDQRLDHLDKQFDLIETKVDGIASFLLASERSTNSLEVRLLKLETRVDKIERDRPA